MSSITTRIGVSYLVILLASITTSGVALYNLFEVNSSVSEILSENYRATLAAENLIQTFDTQENAQLAMLTGDPELNQFLYKEQRDRFLFALSRAQALPADERSRPVLDTIIVHYRHYLALTDSLIAMMEDSLPTAALTSFQFAIIRPSSERVKKYCFKLLEVNQANLVQVEGDTKKRVGNATWTIIVTLLITVAMSIVAVGYITRKIVRPLFRLRGSVQAITRQQFNQKIDIHTDDEIGQLGQEFNKMTERLRHFEQMNINQILAEKSRSETILESIRDPIIVTDDKGRVVLMNSAAMMIRSDILKEGSALQSLRDAFRHEEWSAALDSALDGGEGGDALVPLHLEGKARYYRLRPMPINDPDGQCIGRVVVLQDVTRFRTLDDLKNEFLATVSHELRTPLTSITMTVDILLQQVLGEMTDRQLRLLGDAKKECGRLRKLVNDVLDLSRLESTRREQLTDDISLPTLVEEAVQSLHLLIEEKSLELEIDLSSGIPRFLGNAELLSWTLSNLITNAIRHTPSGGRLAIRAWWEDGLGSLTVEDSGAGIPPADLERIFEKFYQVKDPDQATPGHVGLGLAIVKRAVEMHGGTVSATSELGRGSVFTLRIPIPEIPA